MQKKTLPLILLSSLLATTTTFSAEPESSDEKKYPYSASKNEQIINKYEEWRQATSRSVLTPDAIMVNPNDFDNRYNFDNYAWSPKEEERRPYSLTTRLIRSYHSLGGLNGKESYCFESYKKAGHYGILRHKDEHRTAFRDNSILQGLTCTWSLAIAGIVRMTPFLPRFPIYYSYFAFSTFVLLRNFNAANNIDNGNKINCHITYLQYHEKVFGEKEITDHDPEQLKARVNLIENFSRFSIIPIYSLSYGLLFNAWKSPSSFTKRTMIGAASVALMTQLSTFIYIHRLYNDVDQRYLNLINKHADQMDSLIIETKENPLHNP